MASILSEYHRFLAHLAQRQVHDDVRRAAAVPSVRHRRL